MVLFAVGTGENRGSGGADGPDRPAGQKNLPQYLENQGSGVGRSVSARSADVAKDTMGRSGSLIKHSGAPGFQRKSGGVFSLTGPAAA